jgi:N-acyl-D-amino-acid deacylase
MPRHWDSSQVNAARIRRLGFLCGIAVAACLAGTARAQTYDVVIQGGTIYDGDGGKPFIGDVAINAGKIAYVGRHKALSGKQIIDARGQAVAPGFIDPHSHVLQGIRRVSGPFLAEQDLAQGITTVVLGPDGQESPQSLRELMAQAKTKGVTQNYACYVGHNKIRVEVMGHAKRAAAPTELAKMKGLVREGMEMGCVGLSAGLMYDPGMFSPPEEIIDLAKEVTPYRGIYDSHSRDPVKDFIGSEVETAQIGIAAGITAKLGHLKAVGLPNRGRANELIAKVDAFRAQGHDIVGDVYPYDGAAAVNLDELLIFPDGQRTRDDPAALRTRLKAALAAPASKAALKEASENGYQNGFSWIKVGAYDASRIVDAPGQPELVGKFISIMAAERGEDPFDTLTGILANAKGRIVAVIGTVDETDMRDFLKQPWDMISSDGSYVGLPSPGHPRSTGAFVRVLGRYSRDVGLFPLQEAVRKMTSLTADTLRLYDRGRLQPGKVADVTIFDPKAINDRSDYVHPDLLAVGVTMVLVNGQTVWSGGKPTGATPGVFVSRQTPPVS